MQHVAPDSATRCNRIKPSEAAKTLGINRSSLSRYLQQYAELLDAAGTVDLDELKRHRADNPRIGTQEAASDGAAVGSGGAAKPASGKGRIGSKNRLEEIKSWDAEADWAQKIGQLVDPTKLMDEAMDAITALRDKLMAPEHTMCERLAEERDPLQVKQILREANRATLDALASAFQRVFGDAQS